MKCKSNEDETLKLKLLENSTKSNKEENNKDNRVPMFKLNL